MAKLCVYCVSEIHLLCSYPNSSTSKCCCVATKAPKVEFVKIDVAGNATRADLNLGFSAPHRPVTTVAHPKVDSATVAPIMSAPDEQDGKQQSMRGKWKRTPKSGEAMKDVLATGRARAKLVKPINTGDICEWAGLRFAGGGVIPIIGCANNAAVSIHHGPNKSVLYNEPTNLHKLCQVCHERWHICNDVYYGDVRPENGEAWFPLPDPAHQSYEHDQTTIVNDEAVAYAEDMWQRIRNASRHSRHVEADVLRTELTDFYLDGIIDIDSNNDKVST